MRTHRLLAAVTLTGATLLITACSSTDSTPAPTKPTTAAAAAAAPTVAPSPPSSAAIDAARTKVGLPPSPEPKPRAAYLAALTAIHPEIVNGKDDKAVSRGLTQCMLMRDEKDPGKRTASAERRFIGPTHPDGYGTAASARIVTAVHTYLCPTY